MRIKNVLRNTSWELAYEFTVILLGFLAPRYIILTYGSEVNGLQSTIMQIVCNNGFIAGRCCNNISILII
jgi:hypothetical protein